MDGRGVPDRDHRHGSIVPCVVSSDPIQVAFGHRPNHSTPTLLADRRLDNTPPIFSDAFRRDLDSLIRWRRDVRAFRAEPLSRETVALLLEAMDAAPSVGLSQPWRPVRIQSGTARAQVLANFKAANAEALADQPAARQAHYAKLKLEGLKTAPEHLAVFCDPNPDQGGGLGRHTLSHAIHASAICAIMQLWLVARAHGIGVGWVSILDPDRLIRDLDVPGDWDFVAYLCIGFPADQSDTPELERVGWERRRPPDTRRLTR